MTTPTGDFAAHLLSAIVRIGYAIVLLTSYPLVHFSLRARILEALDHATICKPIRQLSTDIALPEAHTLQLDLQNNHAEHRTASANVAVLGNVKSRPSSRQKAQLLPSGQNGLRQGVAIQGERSSFEHDDNEDSEQCSGEEARRLPGRRAGHPSNLSDSHHPSSTTRLLSAHQDSHRGKRTPITATSPSSPLHPLSQSQSHLSINTRPTPNQLSTLSSDARMTAANLNHWPDARRTRSPSTATFASRLQCLCPGAASICSLICPSVFASGARPVLIGVRCRRCGLCFATAICSCRTGVSRWFLVRTVNNTVSIALCILTWPWRVLTQPWPWHRLQHQTEHFWNQLTLVTLIISYFAAIFIPDIWVVQRINGCTGAVAMSFVFPALMAMHLNPHSVRIKVMSVLLLLVGGTLVVGGLLLPLLPLPVPVPIAVSVLDDVAR